MTRVAVEPGSERWRELVQQGIIKDADRNWFLGDAALEIAPMGDTRANSGALANLRDYSEEIGVAYESLMTYRTVAAKWPHSTRVLSTAWKVHQMLMGRQELIRTGMTVTQAAAALGQKNTGRTGPMADVESRAAAVADLLTDPEVSSRALKQVPHAVADAIKNNHAVTKIARQALRERDDEQYQLPPLSSSALRAAHSAASELAAEDENSDGLNERVIKAMHALRQVATYTAPDDAVMSALEELEGFLHHLQEQRISHPDFVSAVEEYVAAEAK